MNSNLDTEKIKFPIRLVRYLALAGIASRRKSFDIIQSGKVQLNGETVTEPSKLVEKSDNIKIDGKTISLSKFVYIILNKPIGYTCTSADPHAEKKAIDLINLPQYRLFSVGRLDKNSEGLIIFTNDGEFADKIMHPRNNILKTYEVMVKHKLSETKISEILDGIQDDGETLKAVSIKPISNKKYIFVLNEGKKREIRRLVKYAQSDVVRLRRISIGNLQLNSLPTGKWKFIPNGNIIKIQHNPNI